MPIIEGGSLQTTQHDVNIVIVHFGCQPHPLYAKLSLQTLQEIGVIHAAKGQCYAKHEILLFQYISEYPNE